MESNNSIEELIIRYLQNEIQEDELRVLDAWIHESDANKSHFFELKGLFDTRKEVAFLNHYSVERSWERMAGKLDAISGVSVKSKVLGKQFWLSFLRYAAIIVIAMGIGVGMNQWISNRLYAGDTEYNGLRLPGNSQVTGQMPRGFYVGLCGREEISGDRRNAKYLSTYGRGATL